MSNAQTRQDIADALSEVDGISGHTSKPAALNEGDAWPQWRGAEKAGGRVFTHTWAVLVVMPQTDDITADAYADSHGPALVDALRPILYVDSLAPATIPTEAGDMYALLLTGRSE
jgi:hypothetical protein